MLMMALVDLIPYMKSLPTLEGSFHAHTFTLFEGLSATGLRSIRYAKEIPLLR